MSTEVGSDVPGSFRALKWPLWKPVCRSYESGVSSRTQLLPSTLAHTLKVLNTLPTGHETSHDG
jgi:hypothetical protein